MSTLTDTAAFSKKASVWVVIGIIAIIFLMIFLGIGRSVKNAFFPPSPAPPTVAFGKLPRMDLSQGIKARPGIVYNLETITGNFPSLPGVAKVFGVGDAAPSFGTLDLVKSKLANGGFNPEPAELTGGVVKFTDRENETRTITVDVARGDFLLESDYYSNREILEERPDSLESAIDRASGFFKALGIDLVDFGEDKITTKFMRIDGSSLTGATSLSGANLIQVVFNRGDLDGISVIWPQVDEPKFYALVSSQQVVEAKVQNLPIEKFKFATYPLKEPAAAFENLKKGAAAFNKPLTTSEVSIIGVSIGYVESSLNEEFLQPVYFFGGANNFIAYVPAVDEKWIK